MVREKPAACVYMGKFYAESLILAETGNSIGAIQIAGTASQSQIPFFVTLRVCDLIISHFLCHLLYAFFKVIVESILNDIFSVIFSKRVKCITPNLVRSHQKASIDA